MSLKRTRTKLSNGLPLVVVEMPGSRASVVSFWTKAGTRLNPPGKEGLAHLAEHLLVKKTKKYPTDAKLAEVLESVGARKHASTSRDYCTFEIHSSTSDLKLAIDTLSEWILNPVFDKEGLKQEAGVIEQEFLERSGNMVARDLLYQIFYKDSPLGVSNLGTRESLRKISLKDVEDFVGHNYLIDNSLICVAGGVKFAQVRELAEKTFSKFARKNGDWRTPLFKYPRTQPLLVEKRNSAHVTLELAFRTGPLSQDLEELAVIRAILGRGWSSRLVQRLRVKEALIYDWAAGRQRLLDTGAIFFTFSTSKDKFAKLLGSLCEEISKFRDKGVEEEELKKAKGFAIGTLTLDFQTPAGYTDWYATEELLEPDKVESLEEYSAKIRKVSADDVGRTARKIFTNDNWYLAVLGDVKEKEIKVSL